MSDKAKASGAEPSMDEILASIRRILHDDEAATSQPPIPRQDSQAPGDVLILEPSMMVPPPEPAASEIVMPPPEPAASEIVMPPPAETPSTPPPQDILPEPLIAPATAAAAASSVNELVRTLAAERTTPVTRSGPTIEDLVREEIRPVLKAWLDAHLPQMVERAVRAEIERVIGRS